MPQPNRAEIPERFEPVPGFTGYYASPSGELISTRQSKYGKPLRQFRQNDYGHLGVKLSPTPGARFRSYSVHDIVARTFLPSYDERRSANYVIRHLDGNPHNNAVTNLAWGTPEDNEEDKLIKTNDEFANAQRQKHIRNLYADGLDMTPIADDLFEVRVGASSGFLAVILRDLDELDDFRAEHGTESTYLESTGSEFVLLYSYPDAATLAALGIQPGYIDNASAPGYRIMGDGTKLKLRLAKRPHKHMADLPGTLRKNLKNNKRALR